MAEIIASLNVDEWGRVVVAYDTALEVLMSGRDLTPIYVEPSAEIDKYNEMCRSFDKIEEVITPAPDMPVSPETYHAERAKTWLVETQDDDLFDALYAKCNTDEERDRFLEEVQQFGQRGMLPVLSQLKAMIDKLDAAGIVRGVGRGSSVASFLLFLMEVHFVNPLLYDLELSEFLK